ncbi:CheW domain protein [Natrinema pellirubrum DSM 15624]|uniref:CheW domain protein n=1 Tax=Natrinema pellirubrum (strain DSM 15624 / CIP 106293 / JCM 10476 / NCIMB 786 / 157) TaxID=797303 RepID=L0JQ14_NATP1|nr:chemotaxis protein CheW [Natrinema pellirubrum]AGB32471.1 chemotaxis signal transduction protein [Natrinema pellirubrum DSM 15624]ELY73611.1 CheW domain protein [Natrinema pellirubrum DSM 15624]
MGSASNPDDRQETNDPVTVLTFDLEERRYCVGAESVESVLGVTNDEPLADAADPWDAGTITVAGERVSVVDLPRAFGSSLRTTARVDEPKLLVFSVTDDEDRYYGWLVDDVDVTRSVRPGTLEPPRVETTHVKGRIEIDGDEVVWLDERTIHG